MSAHGRIRIGIGGWNYEPWRGTFYPEGLAQKRELEYASNRLSAIEVNGTYYRTQTAASFARWRDETPKDFVFSLKALRFATNRSVLADAGASISGFMGSGLAELGTKLGPVVWQFAPTKRFNATDFEAFLALLPQKAGRLRLRHALEVRHESFKTPEFVALARRFGAAIVFTDSDDYPSFADVTSDFVYARLMRSEATVRTGYPPKELAAWAKRARLWADGGEPADLPRVDDKSTKATKATKAGTSMKTTAAAKAAKAAPRDVFIYFINGAKERAPAAAMALLSLLNGK